MTTKIKLEDLSAVLGQRVNEIRGEVIDTLSENVAKAVRDTSRGMLDPMIQKREDGFTVGTVMNKHDQNGDKAHAVERQTHAFMTVNKLINMPTWTVHIINENKRKGEQ